MPFAFRRPLGGLAFAAVLMAGAAFAVGPAAAAAPTGNPIADAFLAGIEASGAKSLTVGSVTGDGDTAEIVGLDATILDGDQSSKVTIDRVLLDGASVDSGRISADTLTMSGIAISNANGKFTAGKAAATGVQIPSASDIGAGANAVASQSVYSTARLDGIVIADEKGYTVPVESVSFTADQIVDGLARKGTIAANRIVVDVATMPADETRAELQRLGYDRLTISFSAAGGWDPASATGTIDKLQVSAENAGTLTLSGQIGGLTEDVMKKLRGGTAKPEETTQLLQGLTIKEVQLSFDNQTLVNRLLAAQAKETGTTPETLADQLASALPAMLMMLKNKDFETKVAAAGGTFLRNPVSLTATAKPLQPIPVALIVGTLMMAPQTLPNILNVEVVANNQ